MTTPYVLKFAPILKEKVWGGRRLAALGKGLPEGAQVGESWEIADLAATSASGGGGGSARSVITNGALTGRTLHDALEGWGGDLMGGASVMPDGSFPLLVKYLDANEHLSVQVHPSPEYARSHPDAHLKTECWYIVAADPGSVIFKGVRPGVTLESMAEHVRAGTVADDLVAVPAVVGEMHNLPSGTCHALGAGVLVAEVQTPSDTTFRLYDWTSEYDRPERELQIERGLECCDFGPAPGATSLREGATSARLVETEFFTVDEHRLKAGESMTPYANGGPVVLMVISGRARVGGASVEGGETCLIPAALAGRASFDALDDVTVLRVGIGAG